MNGKEPYSLCSPCVTKSLPEMCVQTLKVKKKKKRLYNLQVLPSCCHLGKLRPRDGHSCYLSSCSGLGCACGQLSPLVRARLCPLLESPESAGNGPDLTCRPAHRQDYPRCSPGLDSGPLLRSLLSHGKGAWGTGRRDREGHPGGSWPTHDDPRHCLSS